MTQWSYVIWEICHFGLQGCQIVSASIIEQLKLTLDMHEDTIDPAYYQSIVDKVIQLSHS